MTIKDLKCLLYSDYQRIAAVGGGKSMFFHIEYQTIIWYRLSCYFISKHNIFARLLYFLVRIIQIHLTNKSGIEISGYTPIGKGFRIAHVGSIIIAGGVSIGENCTIHQCVTLGRSFSGSNAGCPSIGNNVIIFPGAVIVGNIKIGDNSIIGANSLVLDDVPTNSVMGGVPAKILSKDSSRAISEEWKKYFISK